MSFDNLRGVEFLADEGSFSHVVYMEERGQGLGLNWGNDYVADLGDFLAHIQKATKPTDEFEVSESGGDTIELMVKNDFGSIYKAFRFSLVPSEHREELVNMLHGLKGTGEILQSML